MKSIITNTIKITLAAVLAILCAQALQLDFAVSAGIVAILSVQPTKKETLRTALARLLAFAVALVISITLLNFLGFTVPVFFLYLLLFILVCQWRKWISAMAMDSVLISHFLSFGKTGLPEIKNEVLLFLLGVGFGILVNLILHKKTDYIEELKNKTDEQIKLALHRMALRIQNPDLADYDGSCFSSLNKSLFTAKKQAEENYNNQFSKKDTFDTLYLEMREKQTKILYEMYKAARNLQAIPPTAGLLSDFLEKVSNEYHKDNDVKALLEELALIHNKMKSLPLPQARSEFEDRANLFILMERLKEFLQIKHDFMIAQNNRPSIE
ncbi:MAG: aromatic acid exporter family protein [Treponema sp.]|nr:aromatic acid exporter family protein [Treponema sp.]